MQEVKLDERIQTQSEETEETEKQLEKIRRVQKKKKKGNYGKLAAFVWLVFIVYHLYTGDLILYSEETILMFIPGVIIGLLIGIGIFYFILFRGFEKIARRFHFSSLTIFTVGMFVEIINIVSNWFAAQWYLYFLNLYF